LDKLQRAAFTSSLLHLLAGREAVGDGELYRTLRELQRAHFLFPVINPHVPNHEAKTRRGCVK